MSPKGKAVQKLSITSVTLLLSYNKAFNKMLQRVRQPLL